MAPYLFLEILRMECSFCHSTIDAHSKWMRLSEDVLICPPCKREANLTIEHIDDWLIYLGGHLQYTIERVDANYDLHYFYVVETGWKYPTLESALLGVEARILLKQLGGANVPTQNSL